MERGRDPVRRGVSLTELEVPTSVHLGNVRTQQDDDERSSEEIGDQSGSHSWLREKQGWVKVKPAPASRKTNLSRSASLSEKELKEARTRSHIIAAQLTVPSNSSSRGVQLFNRRRQRVNAFTLVNIGGEEIDVEKEGGRGRGNHGNTQNLDSPSPRALTWDRKHSTKSQPRSLNHRSKKQVLWPSVTTAHSRGRDMEEAGEVMHEAGDVEDRFLPINQKDEEIPEGVKEPVRDEISSAGASSAAILHQEGDEEEEEEAELKGVYEGSTKPVQAMSNGCHNAEFSDKAVKPVSKQPSTLNRTARPFFSPATVSSEGSGSPAPCQLLAPSHATPSLPQDQEPTPSVLSAQRPSPHTVSPFTVSSRQTFSPPPPAPSYPTPPLPTYASQPPSIPPNPGPPLAISSPTMPTYYATAIAPQPTFVPQFLSERKSVMPIRSGILDEGRARRANRKSMFTFQEKPKLPPNPELLSLVQGSDEMRRGRGPAESQQEEELLALGAEASNFLAKEESGVEEAFVPEWATTLKSSRTRARIELKPEQALTNASGKGAELFAKRQTRMEKYVHENTAGLRSPSPTMSLPPSWVYPSNMPGRVKAIVSSSNISEQISKSLQTQQAAQKKNLPSKAPVPVPAPVEESPALENGCSRVEMELSRHQPYQLNSSLFILNPTRDPLSTLARAAPQPKAMAMVSSYSRQTSLPSSPIPTQYNVSTAYRSAQSFSPSTMSPAAASSSVASPITPERVTSPRSSVQVPKPTFSAKKAGIAPQGKEEPPAARSSSRSSTPTPWTPSLSRRANSAEGSPSPTVWSPSNEPNSAVTSPLSQSTHKPIASLPTPRPIYNPIPSSSASSRSIQSSPVPHSSPSPRPFQNPAFSRPTSNCPPTSPISPPWETTRSQSPISAKANHRLLAKNIINAAKRKNSPSPRALSGHGLPMSPVAGRTRTPSFESKPTSPFPSRTALSPTFTSPPPLRSPPRLYNTRSLTDSDASLESEDSGLRSPGVGRSYNTCPRGWTGSLRVKSGAVSQDL